MTAPAVASVSTPNSGTSGTSITPNAPAGVASGDVLVIAVRLKNGGRTFTVPTGWTRVGTDAGSSNNQLWVARRVADGSGDDTPTVSWDFTTGEFWSWMARITHADGTPEFQESSEDPSAASATVDMPSIDVDVDDSLGFAITGSRVYEVSTPASGFATDVSDTAGNLEGFSKAFNAGATGVQTFTYPGSFEVAGEFLIFNPPAASGTTLNAVSLDADAELGAPTFDAPATLGGVALETESELGGPAVNAPATLAAPALEVEAELGTPAIDAPATLSGSALEADAELGTPTLSSATTLTATPLDTEAELAAPAIDAPATLAATPLEADAELGVPTINVGATLDATPLDADAELGQPAISAPATLTAISFDSIAELGAPTIAGLSATVDGLRLVGVAGPAVVFQMLAEPLPAMASGPAAVSYLRAEP